MTELNVYETLCKNLKNHFTVADDRADFTLGEYMLLQAKASDNALILQAKEEKKLNSVIQSFASFVVEKLAVKELPAKEKVIRTFPIRTAATALSMAVLTCSLVFSCTLVTLRKPASEAAVSMESAEVIEETDAADTQI